MWMLTGVEFVIILLIVFYEFNYESHKSKPLFMMDLSYYVSLMLLNVLILCKYEYFKDEMVMKELLEVVITVMVYWMMLLIVLKLVWEYIPWSYLRNTFCSSKEDDETDKT